MAQVQPLYRVGRDLKRVQPTDQPVGDAGAMTVGVETDVPSAATTDIGAVSSWAVRITGTTAITSLGTAANRFRIVRFAGALTLTFNATSLILPTGANIVTAAGDTCIATSDASGNWTIRSYQRADGTALVGAASALLYTAQSLTAGQQDQVRANVLGAVPLTPAANVTLTALDHERAIGPTAAITITAANATGWRSGPICNTTALSALVTLAVPAGAALDGVTNGTTTLYPLQRARIVQTGATAYITDWIERAPFFTPIVANGVAAADVNLPVGYTKFVASVTAINPSTSGAYFGFRLGDAGGVKAGASDYTTTFLQGTSSAAAGSQDPASSYGSIARNLSSGTLIRALSTVDIWPGSAAWLPNAKAITFKQDSSPGRVLEVLGIDYAGATTGAMGRANLLRFYVNTGTVSFNATVQALP